MKFVNDYITFKGLTIEKHSNGYFIKGFNSVGLHIFESMGTLKEAKKEAKKHSEKTLLDFNNELKKYGRIINDKRISEIERVTEVYYNFKTYIVKMLLGNVIEIKTI